jgi:hypothetical protein
MNWNILNRADIPAAVALVFRSGCFHLPVSLLNRKASCQLAASFHCPFHRSASFRSAAARPRPSNPWLAISTSSAMWSTKLLKSSRIGHIYPCADRPIFRRPIRISGVLAIGPCESCSPESSRWRVSYVFLERRFPGYRYAVLLVWNVAYAGFTYAVCPSLPEALVHRCPGPYRSV